MAPAGREFHHKPATRAGGFAQIRVKQLAQAIRGEDPPTDPKPRGPLGGEGGKDKGQRASLPKISFESESNMTSDITVCGAILMKAGA